MKSAEGQPEKALIERTSAGRGERTRLRQGQSCGRLQQPHSHTDGSARYSTNPLRVAIFPSSKFFPLPIVKPKVVVVPHTYG